MMTRVKTMVEIDIMKAGWTRTLLALALVAGATACGQAEADDGAQETAFARVINVEVRQLETQPFVEEIRLTGVVRANKDVQVSAEESGPIREIFVDKGEHVREGEALFQIDRAILQAQVDQARAQADLAVQTWERRKRLWEEDRVGSEIAYLQAKFGAEQASANLTALEERLARTTIRAPFDGVLEDRMVEVGSMVAPGQVVARVVDLDPVKIVAGVPERYAGDVKGDAQARVTFDLFPGEEFTIPISYVGATVSPQNRTFLVEAMLENEGGLIKPAMVANVSLTRRSLAEALIVPQDALVRVEDGYVVFVVEERDNVSVAAVRPVELGPSQRNTVVIESGLDLGDRVIVVGQKSVADGDRVNVVAAE